MRKQLSRFMNIVMEIVRIYHTTMKEDLRVEAALKAGAPTPQEKVSVETMLVRLRSLETSVENNIQTAHGIVDTVSDEVLQTSATELMETLRACQAYMRAFGAACEAALRAEDGADREAIFAACDEARSAYQEKFERFRGHM